MSKELIRDQKTFEDLCLQIKQAGLVVFDTEFISEHTYHPDLCLMQFQVNGKCCAVDPFNLQDLSPWWEIMIDDATTVIVHGGQAEVRFCLVATNQPPRKLVDIQLAEGFRSRSYPLGYTALVNRVLGKRISSGETRTDWRRRPLSQQQIQYALKDVEYPQAIWEAQQADLKQQNRLAWVEDEFLKFVADLERDFNHVRWKKLSGLQKLNRRELAVAREIARWREAEAKAKNRPVRQTLRDDLILELARRQPETQHDLLGTRDMNRKSYRGSLPALLEAISRGKKVPDAELPRLPRTKGDSSNEQVLARLLAMALSNRCADMNLSMQLVGTNSDLKDLIREHIYGDQLDDPPMLTQGWRAEVCGDLLTDLLDGKIALRVKNPKADAPLSYESIEEK